MSRLNELMKILKEDPNDPFTLYAIATEYLNIDLTEARKQFEYLLQNHPNYIPTYYHIAKLYENLDEYDLAIQTYQKGIAMAKQQHESLALRELTNAYQELLME